MLKRTSWNKQKKAMYLLFVRINNLNLPLDLQLKIFDNKVLPILTYGCEIWVYENNDMVERLHTEFLRKITKTRKRTPFYMLYAELGRYPIQITIDARMIKFWNKIVIGKQSKMSYYCYQSRASKWIDQSLKIFETTDKLNIWTKQQ